MFNNSKNISKLTKDEFDFILQEGESYLIEFKENVDKSLSKEITAFANASGGRIFIGINDNNIPVGIAVTNKIKSQIQDIAHNIQPATDIKLATYKNILIIIVAEGNNKPYQCADGFFIRMGVNSQKMQRDQIVDFLQFEGKIKFDEQFSKDFNFNKNYDSDKLNRFLQLSSITKNLDDVAILENLGVVRNTKMNNAGILFFSHSIELLCEQAIITCAVFDGVERIKILNRKDFNSDIVSNIDEALHFVKQAINVEYIMTGEARRKEIYEFPLEALREAIVNAAAHRDYYFVGAHTTVDIFDDRIEICNPGGLPRGLNKENFGKKAVRRNQLIASLLQRCRFVENMGTGINKIKQLCKENGNHEPIFEFDSFYTVIFNRVKGGVKGGVKGNEEILLKLIFESPGKRTNELAEILETPKRTVEKWIKKLRDGNKIIYKGSNKIGGYFALNKN